MTVARVERLGAHEKLLRAAAGSDGVARSAVGSSEGKADRGTAVRSIMDGGKRDCAMV